VGDCWHVHRFVVRILFFVTAGGFGWTSRTVEGPLLAKLVFAGNMLGAAASLFATLLFIDAAYVSL
jgi:hypothetical protein